MCIIDEKTYLVYLYIYADSSIHRALRTYGNYGEKNIFKGPHLDDKIS